MNVTPTTPAPVPTHDPAKPVPTSVRSWGDHWTAFSDAILAPHETGNGQRAATFRDGFVDGFMLPFKVPFAAAGVVGIGVVELGAHGAASAVQGLGALAGKVSEIIRS